ncbi:MAG: ATP synthase F0 subunit C [Bacillota bacterium]|nr:MAG: F0F1 ATP synthase subunit C [Bacillota bacterium]
MEITGIAFFSALAVIGLAFAAFGSALGQSRAAAAAMDAIWRQPEAAGRIQTALILSLAFIESLTLFTFALAFLFAGRVAG